MFLICLVTQSLCRCTSCSQKLVLVPWTLLTYYIPSPQTMCTCWIEFLPWFKIVSIWSVSYSLENSSSGGGVTNFTNQARTCTGNVHVISRLGHELVDW